MHHIIEIAFHSSYLQDSSPNSFSLLFHNMRVLTALSLGLAAFSPSILGDLLAGIQASFKNVVTSSLHTSSLSVHTLTDCREAWRCTADGRGETWTYLSV